MNKLPRIKINIVEAERAAELAAAEYIRETPGLLEPREVKAYCLYGLYRERWRALAQEYNSLIDELERIRASHG